MPRIIDCTLLMLSLANHEVSAKHVIKPGRVHMPKYRLKKPDSPESLKLPEYLQAISSNMQTVDAM